VAVIGFEPTTEEKINRDVGFVLGVGDKIKFRPK